MLKTDKNIVLIGMPGVGKSTIGVLLAKHLSRVFVDTDVYIQAIEGRRLQDIIDEKGVEYFRKLEEEHVLCIDVENAVIATGGSVVYGERAMQKFMGDSVIVHLDLPLADVVKRVTNLDSRGVVMEKSQTLESLFVQREPLYRKYADISVDVAGLNHEQTLWEIVQSLEGYCGKP